MAGPRAEGGLYPAHAAERVVVFLNGARGLAALDALKGHGVPVAAAVVPAGRPSSAELARAIEAESVKALAVTRVNDAEALAVLGSLDADVFVIAGYSEIFRADAIALPRLLTMNLHAGPLPGYRGGSPLNWQIINGEGRLGVSLIRIDAGIDTGPVLKSGSFGLGPDETIADAHARANALFQELLTGAFDDLAAGRLRERPQTDDGARYWKQRGPEDGRIDPQAMTARQVHDLVRAVTRPYPGAFLERPDGRITVWRTQMCAPRDAPDVLVCADGAAVRLLESEAGR